MELYADENFPLRIVEEMRRLGHDILTIFEDGRANQSSPDSDVLVRATHLGRALLTLNRQDFKRLHNLNSNHAGIIICTEDPDRLGQARRIDTAIGEHGQLQGKLIRVYRAPDVIVP
ncbi:MAG TPA: DUF5615 family PIN-like protein [Pyrinomonadaceae bacterium]|nr:DUF5615 family PIN-like protein [Pyrinomonadaceae bacterium]